MFNGKLIKVVVSTYCDVPIKLVMLNNKQTFIKYFVLAFNNRTFTRADKGNIF